MKDVAFWSEYRPNVDSKACDGDNRRTQEKDTQSVVDAS